MPVLTQLNLNIGTEQNPNMVLHDLHDIRISSTDVNTVTRLLGCDAGVNSIAPLTLANAASLLGVHFTGITLSMPSDWNSASMGIYRGTPSGTGAPSSSTATMGYLLSFTNLEGTQGVQFYIENNGGYLIWVRSRSKSIDNWNAWRSLPTTA